VPGRSSVVGIARGSGGGRSLMLNAHLDTVGTAGMVAPFSGGGGGGPPFRGGAPGEEGGPPPAMLAGRDAVRLGVCGGCVGGAAADEEAGSIGTEAVLDQHGADAAIVAEPTWLELAIGHRGFVGIEVEVAGRAAHGSRPDRGLDAIVRMGRVLLGLEALDTRLQSGPRHPLPGTASPPAPGA